MTPAAQTVRSGSAAQVLPQKGSVPAGNAPLAVLADRCFDLVADEREGLKDQGTRALVQAVQAVQALQAAKPAAAAADLLLGVLGECAITGCDVHYLTPAIEILEHVKRGAGILPEFTEAREYLQTPEDDVVAVLVFESGCMLLCSDGSLRRMV